MKYLENWGLIHHANLASTLSSTDIWETLHNKLDFKRVGNPDALHLELESFGIDDARDLCIWSYKKPFGERKVAVVSMKSFTSEAQNALLKLFEEPPLGTYFFLLTQSLGSVLPTLLSRVRIIDDGADLEKEIVDKKIQNFFEGDISSRFKIINPIIKNKDKEKAKEFIHGLLAQVNKNIDAGNLELLLKAESYINGRAPSLKMILESLAIMVV